LPPKRAFAPIMVRFLVAALQNQLMSVKVEGAAAHWAATHHGPSSPSTFRLSKKSKT